MSRVRDSKGRIRSNIVLGRKFCRVCGCWKLVCYFPPRLNKKLKRIYLHSECEPCRNRLAKRDRRTMTGKRLERRRERERQASLRYLQRIRERDPNYIVWSNGRGYYIAAKFVEFLNPTQAVEDGGQAIFIRGKRLTRSEVRMLHRWRTGEVRTIRTHTVDQWAIQFDLPMWEIDERAAKIAA